MAVDLVHEVLERRRERARLLDSAIVEHLADGRCEAFLVWGDPALYDSTIAVVGELRTRGRAAIEHRVIPGVSSIATLAARHRIGLNRVGRPFLVTTGRRIAIGLPYDVDDLVVMLEAHCAFTRYTEHDLDIFWGAYLGTPDEILVSGSLAEVAPRIVYKQRAAHERKGWIMDTYLLRRRDE